MEEATAGGKDCCLYTGKAEDEISDGEGFAICFPRMPIYAQNKKYRKAEYVRKAVIGVRLQRRMKEYVCVDIGEPQQAGLQEEGKIPEIMEILTRLKGGPAF